MTSITQECFITPESRNKKLEHSEFVDLSVLKCVISADDLDLTVIFAIFSSNFRKIVTKTPGQ